MLPTLSRVFERLLVPKLRRHIESHIPREQLGFMRAPVLQMLVYLLLLLLLQPLISVVRPAWWLWISRGHLTVSGGKVSWHIFRVLVFEVKLFNCLNHIYPIVISELLHHQIPRTYILLLLEFLREQYDPLPYLIYTVVWEKFMVRNICEKKIRGKNFRLSRP